MKADSFREHSRGCTHLTLASMQPPLFTPGYSSTSKNPLGPTHAHKNPQKVTTRSQPLHALAIFVCSFAKSLFWNTHSSGRFCTMRFVRPVRSSPRQPVREQAGAQRALCRRRKGFGGSRSDGGSQQPGSKSCKKTHTTPTRSRSGPLPHPPSHPRLIPSSPVPPLVLRRSLRRHLLGSFCL